VTSLTSADIDREGSVIPQDFLNSRVPGVVVDDLQGNAFQTGVQYRGFEASPVNGLPQGLAVYQNGVRINEAFGDTVNWDFIPENAIADLAIMGSNPVFGLNAIGGALAITMKDGFGYQGAEVDTRFGSFGRKQVSAEAGMQSGAFAVYGAFEGINDDGFRDFSDAEVRRGYADLGLKTDNAEFHLNFTGADNYVGVTAAVPPELLAYGDKRTFTSPQTTYNDMQMYSLNGTVKATDTLTFSGVTYYRRFKQKHDDGNIAEFDECEDEDGNELPGLCGEDGEEIFAQGAPGVHIDLHLQQGANALRRLLGGEPRPDRVRDRLLRSREPLHHRERTRLRPSPRAGGVEDVGGGPARRAVLLRRPREARLEPRLLPHQE
jgi:iron complex outermembrane receptor protein